MKFILKYDINLNWGIPQFQFAGKVKRKVETIRFLYLISSSFYGTFKSFR